jgi:predicted O-methyltransferase YrrM
MIRCTIVSLLFFSFVFSQALADSHGSSEKQLSLELNRHYLKNYNFTLDSTFRGFIRQIPVWKKVLRPFKGKPNIHYLEIGVNQGRSAIWVLENILTHPTSTLAGIDIFPEGTDWKEKYLSNLDMSGFAHKATTIEGFSQIKLRSLPLNSFDIIYIDGDHKADGVLADAVLSWDLLKAGGILIFDDYLWFKEHLPDELRPQIAIDSFITAYRNSIEVVHRGNQVFIRKRKGPCLSFNIPPIGCSPIGQYIYVWNWNMKNKLYHQEMCELIKISDKEKRLIQSLIKSPKFGKAKLFLDSTMSKDKDFINLSERLKLDFTNIEKEPGFLETLSLLGRRLYRFLQSQKRKAAPTSSN